MIIDVKTVDGKLFNSLLPGQSFYCKEGLFIKTESEIFPDGKNAIDLLALKDGLLITFNIEDSYVVNKVDLEIFEVSPLISLIPECVFLYKSKEDLFSRFPLGASFISKNNLYIKVNSNDSDNYGLNLISLLKGSQFILELFGDKFLVREVDIKITGY
jgi:hypothetical protein